MNTKQILSLSEPAARTGNILALLFLTVFTLSAASTAGAQHKTEIRKSENLSSSDVVRLEVAHQDVSITTWNSPKLEAVVKISVKTDKKEDAEKVFSFYDFEIDRSGGRVTVSMDPFKNQVKNMNTNNGVTRVTLKNGDTFSYSNLEVDVEIFTSKKHALELESKFSEISLGDMEASVSIELSSSELKGNDLASLTLEAQFSQLLFNNCRKASIEVKSSDLTMNDVNDVSLECSFSEVEFNNVQTLKLEMQSGDLEVEQVKNVSGKCAFSQVSIEHLTGGITLEAQSTTLNIDKVSGTFEIDLDCDFSTVEIDLDGQGYALEVNAQFSSVETSKGELEPVDQFGQRIEYEGRIGSAGSNSTVSIACNSCSVELK